VVCKCCGVEAPTKYVEFYQCTGALFIRHQEQIRGNLCRSCIDRHFWRFTLTTLTLGWWEAISFFLTPLYIWNNLISYLGTLTLKSAAVNAQTRRKRKNAGESQHLPQNLDLPKLPIRERDRFWFNTKDSRPNLPQETEPSGDSSIRELIQHLGCGNHTESRRRAAEILSQRGAAATPAISALLIACVDVDATVRETSLNALESIDPNWLRNLEVEKALPKLTEEFKHSYCFRKAYSEDVSKVAYKLLQQIGKPAVSFLADLIVEEEDKIEYQIHAIWVLRDIGLDATDAVPQLVQALRSRASQVRIAAAETLANFGSVAKDAIPELITGLADRDEDVRKAMVAGLVATEPAVPELLALSADRNHHLHDIAIAILIKIGPKTTPALIETVSQWCIQPKTRTTHTQRSEKITEAALHVMSEFGSDASSAVPTIALALVDSTPSIKLAAARSLESIVSNWVSDPATVKAIVSFAGADAAIPEFIAGLADPNEAVRKAMAACLAVTESAVPDLLPLLIDKNPDVREAVTDVLRQIDSRALPALTGIVSRWCNRAKVDVGNVEQFQKITEAVLQVMAEFGSQAADAVPTIALLLVDSSPTIKLAAVRALGNIDRDWMSDPSVAKAIIGFAGTEAAVSKLVVGFANREAMVRGAMVACLAQLGLTAKPAVPNLKKLILTELDPEVHKAATEALMKIEPQPGATVSRKPPNRPQEEAFNFDSFLDDLESRFKKAKSSKSQPSSQSSNRLHCLQQELLKLLQGDSRACQRLIELERSKKLHSREDELYENVIRQLERDRK
jgi:HEAT repeat protein